MVVNVAISFELVMLSTFATVVYVPPQAPVLLVKTNNLVSNPCTTVSVVVLPSPVNLYHTPIVPVVDEFGAVSDTAFTVVPAKADVAQGKLVAPEQASFEGGDAVVKDHVLHPEASPTPFFGTILK